MINTGTGIEIKFQLLNPEQYLHSNNMLYNVARIHLQL